jgi:hypothetical protein
MGLSFWKVEWAKPCLDLCWSNADDLKASGTGVVSIPVGGGGVPLCINASLEKKSPERSEGAGR